MKLEIAVVSAAGAVVAVGGGAHRVELCCALELGGLTPSQGLAESTLAGLDGLSQNLEDHAGVHPLIRCRPGDFIYSEDDVRTMVAETKALLRMGCAGVVVGALTPHGDVDKEAMMRLADAAREINPAAELTFHRAMDQAADPLGVIDELASLGFTRILTSGQAPSAGAGLAMLKRMVKHAGGRIDVMAGGGLAAADIPAMHQAGVSAVHLSAKRTVSTAGHAIALGTADGADPTAYQVTDKAIVKAAAAACTNFPVEQ